MEDRWDGKIVWEERPTGFGRVEWALTAVPLTAATAWFGWIFLFRAKASPAVWVPALVVVALLAAMVWIFARRALPGPKGRITLDSERGHLRAEHMSIGTGFWPGRRVASYDCPFEHIEWIHEHRGRRGTRWLRIRCTDAELRIDNLSTGYDELYAALRQLPLDEPDVANTGAVLYMVYLIVVVFGGACLYFGWF